MERLKLFFESIFEFLSNYSFTVGLLVILAMWLGLAYVISFFTVSYFFGVITGILLSVIVIAYRIESDLENLNIILSEELDDQEHYKE